nr:nitrilase-related carbon-nitrogen hydrolase [uncultured Agathobaculum sp.]
MKLALAQFGASSDKLQNLAVIRRFAEQAAKSGASMLFLPEYSMFYAKTNRHSLNKQAAEPLDGSFAAALGSIARQNSLWLAAGIYEQTDGLPYNTIILLDDAGTLRGFHRKQKLYDAFGYRESDECQAGDTPFAPVQTPAGRLGIITCFELRFPALAAAQKAAGADLLYIPAGWATGANKLLHWRTLLCARAIENSMMVLGVDQYLADCFIGHSAVFAPDGTVCGALGEGDGLLTITI